MCDFYGLEPHVLDLKTRKQPILECRQMCHCLAVKYTPYSLQKIGISIGGKNHSTVLHSKTKIQHLCEYDKELRKRKTHIEALISNDFKEIDRSVNYWLESRTITNCKHSLYLVSKLPNIDKEFIQKIITYLELL